MIQPRITHEIPKRAREPRLRILGAEHEARDPGQDHRTGAHRAGLERDVESTAVEPPGAHRGGGLTKREDLGMRGRVPSALALIAERGEHLLLACDHGADRHVAPRQASPRLLERGRHHSLIAVRHGNRPYNERVRPLHRPGGAADNKSEKPGGPAAGDGGGLIANPSGADAELTEYRLRTVRIGVLATVFVLIALLAYVLYPGHDEINRGASLAVMGVGLIGAIAVAFLPWRRLFERGLGMTFMYAWSVLDIVLVTLLISFAGDSHMEVFFLYAFTTLFFAASYPIRGQLVLLAFTFACYLGVIGYQGWPIETPDLVARLGLLVVLMYMSSFLARELQKGMRESADTREEADRRARLLATVGRAARGLSSLDSSRVLEEVVGSAARLGFEAAHLARHNPEEATYSVQYAIGLPDAYVNVVHPIDAGMTGLVHERLETVVLEDYAVHPRALPVLIRAGFSAGIATPVWVNGDLDATLVAWSRVPRPITAPDVEAFELLAALAGRALENAQRFEEEQESVKRLAELDRLKSDFLANVSHELRTPLTAIEGIGVTLERRWEHLDEATQREFLGHLNANATSLHQIITALLDFSTLEAGRLELDIRDVPVRPWLEHMLSRLRSLTETHRVTLDAPSDVSVLADPVLLDRVVENLLSNAVKHTPKGTHVTLSAATEDGHATISVADDGPGIPPWELPHLGDRFFRGGDAATRKTRGTGLGLAFVREILELHGSDLEIVSEQGVGAKFSFRLPVSRSLSDSA